MYKKTRLKRASKRVSCGSVPKKDIYGLREHSVHLSKSML